MEKVIVDKNVCIGCGFCAANCEDIFTIEDDGLAVAKDNNLETMDNDEKENVLDIKEGCPVGAIKLEDNNGN